MSKPATVYVIDDDNDVRKALCWLLESIDLNVESFDSATQFMQSLRPEMTGCILSDVRMPKMSGIELQKQIMEQSILMPVILLTGFADIPMAVGALKEGAFDFLEKPCHDQTVLDAVQSALLLNEKRQQEHSHIDCYRRRMASLTQRERQVVELITAGSSNNETAARLNIGIRAVETYRSNAMKKMKAKSLANLVYMYARANEKQKVSYQALAS